MKKTLLFLAGIVVSAASFAQPITYVDDLSWVTAPDQNTATRPFAFALCNDTALTYTITTSAIDNNTVFGFGPPVSNPNIPSGIQIPIDNHNNDGSESILINFNFTRPVTNLRIHFRELDENETDTLNPGPPAEEFLHDITPSYNSLTPTINQLYSLPVGGPPYTGVTPQNPLLPAANNNAGGWVEWNVTGDNYSISYDRPISWAMAIDSIEFEFECDTACPCPARIKLRHIGNASTDGLQVAKLRVNSAGELISSLSIDMNSYQSIVNDECLKCDNPNVESFGTFINAPSIAGAPPVLVDPLNVGNSRRVEYTFNPPVAINEVVFFDLQFPPILQLSCCKNKVDFCFVVDLRKDDCTSCEYLVCTIHENENENESRNGNSNPQQNVSKNPLKVSVSPNPMHNQLGVKIEDEHFNKGELFLHSSEGKLLRHIQVNKKSFTLDVASLPKGAIVLTIISNDKKESKTLIKL
jgi:hypothetical protein